MLSKSGIPSPAPAFSAISWKSLSCNVVIGSVNAVILVPVASIITCGKIPAPVEAATPASNCTIASSVAALPPSMNASSSTSNVTKSSLVEASQSYTLATLLLAFSTRRITLSPTLNL